MKHVFLLCIILLCVGGTVWVFTGRTQAETDATYIEEGAILPKDEGPHEDILTHVVADGDTFASIMESFGISYADMLAIVDAAKDQYDFTSIKLGHPLRLVKENNTPVRLEYDINPDEMVTVDLSSSSFTTKRFLIPYEVTVKKASATIDDSLFLAGGRAGLPDALILEIADTFAWSIDFSTNIQKGDSFTVLYESRVRNGQDAGAGHVLAATFTNVGKEYSAFLFEDSEGNRGYYDKDGNSTVRAFLKAPLKFSRITSGFTYARFHPTVGKVLPHMAIDYSAPVGTPILATADGIVRYAGWKNGGYGNYISIKHNDTFETHYQHLNGVAKGVKVGARVTQGQVIGYVGTTGNSTGPHLHYEIQKNSRLVNPLTIELPPGKAVAEEYKDAFFNVKDKYLTQLK